MKESETRGAGFCPTVHIIRSRHWGFISLIGPGRFALAGRGKGPAAPATFDCRLSPISLHWFALPSTKPFVDCLENIIIIYSKPISSIAWLRTGIRQDGRRRSSTMTSLNGRAETLETTGQYPQSKSASLATGGFMSGHADIFSCMNYPS